MDADGVDLTNVRVRRIWKAPRPHLLRYMWWFMANHVVRAWDVRSIGPPDVVHSTGVNCLDARVMSVHIVFAKFWQRVRRSVLGDLRNPARGMPTLPRQLLAGPVGRLGGRVRPRRPP